jgi:benzoyl-CoA-dihydrodiol lyase
MREAAQSMPVDPTERVTFDTHPTRYRHWEISFEGPMATLALNVNEAAGIRPGYALKLNSYDLGVDIELRDALERIRFEHPEVRTVVLTSAKEKVFSSGANIFMLGLSSHAWKVNFCKFTNETRNSMEDSSRRSGLKFLAACNGTTAGGGYELALACDEILLIDDRSASVSLPEIALLGVLPGTGGLTRLTDKRKVRRDHADLFCTVVDGVRAPRAKAWRLIDDFAKPQGFNALVKERALELAKLSDRPRDGAGIELTPLARTIDDRGYHYSLLDVEIDRCARTATLTARGPSEDPPSDIAALLAQGARWWPLALARELDDAILLMRTNDLQIGTWILKTRGDLKRVLALDATLAAHANHWFVRETVGLLRRTLARLEVSARTLFALIEPGSCFAGTLLELALAADRSYMLSAAQSEGPSIALSGMNFGDYDAVTRRSRLESRFYGDESQLKQARSLIGRALGTQEALEVGLVTVTPDELDWNDEIRLAIEERTSLSPDALSGMEASLRFGDLESLETRIFGRLSAWQNWIFVRPNAVGEAGALKVFGTGNKARFDWERI